jgi:hypothetical protein
LDVILSWVSFANILNAQRLETLLSTELPDCAT